MTKYWYNVPKCKMSSSNTKPFFEECRQTLKLSKKSLFILEFPINFFWSFLKPQIRSSEQLNIGSTIEISKFGQQIQNHFSSKTRQTLKLSKKFLAFPINLFWSLSKVLVESSERLNIGIRLKNVKCAQRIQNHLPGNVRETSKPPKTFFPMFRVKTLSDIMEEGGTHTFRCVTRGGGGKRSTLPFFKNWKKVP